MTSKLRLFAQLGVAVIALAAVLVSVPVTEAVAADACWKNSYGRGAGTVPKNCGSNEDKIGALCYPKCRQGMKRFGFDCHSVCPAGFKSKGLFCRKDAKKYNRGAGRGKKKCERKFGGGNCEKRAGLWYQKCRAGFVRSGIFCLPSKPDCGAIGLKKGLAGRLGCAKKIVIGKPRSMDCPAGKSKQAGLCYKGCRSGFKGVGPVCWGKPPKRWRNCGMAATKDKKTCNGLLADQVLSVGESALFIASLGTSSGATTAAKSTKLGKARKTLKKMKKAWKTVKKQKGVEKAIKNANKAYEGTDAALTALDATDDIIDAMTWEEIMSASAAVSSIFDPTGVSSIVSAYSMPKCSKLQ